jgi:hypothetical protein
LKHYVLAKTKSGISILMILDFNYFSHEIEHRLQTIPWFHVMLSPFDARKVCSVHFDKDNVLLLNVLSDGNKAKLPKFQRFSLDGEDILPWSEYKDNISVLRNRQIYNRTKSKESRLYPLR